MTSQRDGSRSPPTAAPGAGILVDEEKDDLQDTYDLLKEEIRAANERAEKKKKEKKEEKKKVITCLNLIFSKMIDYF